MAEERSIGPAAQVVLMVVFTPIAALCVLLAPVTGLTSLGPASLFAGVVGWAAQGGPEEPSPFVRGLLLAGLGSTVLMVLALVAWSLLT